VHPINWQSRLALHNRETLMPQSYTCLRDHLVFSTKDRKPTITPEIRSRLWEYLGGIVRAQNGIPIQIGGTDDHVHLLVTLGQDVALSDFLRELKAGSSGWVHDTFPTVEFWWQAGYGAFTVSHSVLDVVKAYIANQDEHHAKLSYQEEFRTLLVRHGIAFDERYLWD
jgi:REP element-mobilizing transposase RayT